MSIEVYDIIIIGSGMSGLFSAYNIQKMAPTTRFLILEKYKRNWLGGRTSNETFYGSQIVTGAGIGRKDTNPLLIQLMNELNIKYSEFNSIMSYSKLFHPVDIVKIINKLKIEYKKHPELHRKTFKQFAVKCLGADLYKQFVISSGYTDYENADISETLYNYGMDDNKSGWIGLHIPWKIMVETLYHKIGKQHFKFSNDVISLNKIRGNPCLFEIKTSNEKIYYSNKVIIASTINTIQKLLPSKHIYKQIHGQSFLRLYGKFDKKSAEIMKQYVPNYTIVPGPLQKIIPINTNKGIYMIAYSDNDNAVILKDHLENTEDNRTFFCKLIEQSLGISAGSLRLISIKDYYWPIGTHYYEPLKLNYDSRDDFVYDAQHPQKGLLVVGEAISRYQGWTEGALESVNAVLSKEWVKKEC